MTPISEAEAVVMEVLWQQAPRSADDVVAALAHRDWAEPTIKTLLNRLLTKGAIAAERDGRRYLYRCCSVRRGWRRRAGTSSTVSSKAAWHRWWRTSANVAS